MKEKTPGVDWPAAWDAKEGWVAPGDETLVGGSWTQVDNELKKSDTSLEERMAQLGGPAVDVASESTNHARTVPEEVLEEVLIADLICDERTQVRAAENEQAIESYAEALKNGAQLPAPIAFRDDDGKLWVSEGHHTIKAHRLRGVDRITTRVRRGSAKDARMHAYTSNLTHGVQLTAADKRKVIEGLIKDTDWSDRKIADHVRFWSKEKVRGVRLELSGKPWRKTKPAPDAEVKAEEPSGVETANGWHGEPSVRELAPTTTESIARGPRNPSKPSKSSIAPDQKLSSKQAALTPQKEIGSAASTETVPAIEWTEAQPRDPMNDAQIVPLLVSLAESAERETYAVHIDKASKTIIFATKNAGKLALGYCRILRSAEVNLPVGGHRMKA